MAFFHIPAFPASGQRFAFVDREEQVRAIYDDLVSAGNEVRAGSADASLRLCVQGPKGSGKSSTIVHVLRLLRGEVPVPDGWLQPDAPERWMIFRVSGKSIGSSEGLMQAVMREMHTEAAPGDLTQPTAIERALSDLLSAPVQQLDTDKVLELRWWHRLFQTKDARAFAAVRKALETTRQTLDIYRNYAGGVLNRARQTGAEFTTRSGHSVGASGAAAVAYPGVADATVKASIDRARELVGTTSESEDLQMKVRIDSVLMVDALNDLFQNTQRAGLPTILVLDDLDEVAGEAGVSYAKRAALLKQLIGPFLSLKPTVTIVSLRSEYVTEDIGRSYRETAIPPLPVKEAHEAVATWSTTSGLLGTEHEAVLALGHELLAPLQKLAEAHNTSAGVLPWTFLDLLQRLTRTRARPGTL